MLDFPVEEQRRLSASYLWRESDRPAFSIDGTLAFVGNAPVEQTAQRVTVRGDYDTNFLAIPGGTLRDRFLVAPIRPAHVRSAHS